jgi:hypothetical protein
MCVSIVDGVVSVSFTAAEGIAEEIRDLKYIGSTLNDVHLIAKEWTWI